MRSNPSPGTLKSFAEAIRELEQQTTAARKERDRMLAKARDAAQSASQHAAQARDLREILSELAPDFFKEQFGYEFDVNADPARDEVLQGIRDAVAYLEATPQLPLHRESISLDVPYHKTDEGKRAEIDSLAAITGCATRETWYGETSGTYWLDGPTFGPVSIYASVNLKGPKPEPKPDPEPVESAEAVDEPPGGEADVALLDAEQVEFAREAEDAQAAVFAEVDEAAYRETSAQYEGFGESAEDDAPTCRECGTWPCSRHATDEDRAEQAAAEVAPEGADA